MSADLQRLEETLHILQSKQIEIQSNSRRSPTISPSAPENNHSHNRFSPLGQVAAADKNMTEVEDTGSTTKMDEGRPTKTERMDFDDRHDRLAILDDDLGEWIELCYYTYVGCILLDKTVLRDYTNRPLKSLDAVLEQCDRYWTEGANGTLPICLAAWLSSTAFYEVGVRSGEFDYDTLLSKWTRHQSDETDRDRFKNIPGLQSETRRFADPQGLSHHKIQLEHYQTLQKDVSAMPQAGRYEDFTKIIAPFSQNKQEFSFREHLAMHQMLKHMRQLLTSKRAIAAIEAPESPQPICEPLLPFIDKVCSDKELPIHVQLIFGMEMLLSSYQAHTWPGGVLNRQNCRALVLRFALEVQKSVSEAISCVRKTALASVSNLQPLQKVLDSLEGYSREVRFDLYHQAPWTAGCHMVEILTVAMFEGLHLCCDTVYLCALLHIYNALRSIDSGFRHVELLDQLCEIFQDKLFLGGFPTENFSSHFRRVNGGGFTRKTNANLNSQTGLSKPIGGLSRRKTGSTRLSYFYDHHTFGYEATADFWHLNFEAKPRWQPTTQREQAEAMRRAYSSPLAVSLEKIKENVVQEFNGPLPVARINYLAVFVFGANSMEELCKSFSAVKEGTVQPDRDLGVEVVDSLLVDIVDHLRDSDRRPFLRYWRPVKNAKLFFNGLDSKLSLSQFLWTSAI